MLLLLESMSKLTSVLDMDIMHIGAAMVLGDTSGIIGGSPRKGPRMDDGLNWLGPYS